LRLLAAVLICLLATLPASATNTTSGDTLSDFPISAGTSTGFLGSAIGLDFRSGRLLAAWGDNSAALGGNPDLPALDVAFAAVVGGVAGTNVNVTALPSSQSSVSLAVSPLDSDLIVAAAVDESAPAPSVLRATSRDGGLTWTVVRGLPGSFGGFAPSVAFDSFGNCFLALVDDPDFGNPRPGLFVSTDAGATFSKVALPELPGLETHVSVAAGFGAVWIAFQSYDGSVVRIRTLAAPVTGLGAIGTFTPQTLPGSEDGREPDVALGPGGFAVVGYGQGALSPAPTVTVQIDADGLGTGAFGPAVPVANVPGYPNLPQAAVGVDRQTARIHLVYRDRQDAGASDEIRLSFKDSSADWSAALTVNDFVPSTLRILPNVALDADGSVGVAWYDIRNHAAEVRGRVLTGIVRPAEPRAPLNLLPSAATQSRIELSWSDVSDNEDGFVIERRDGDIVADPEIVAELPANTTTWADDGLPANATFVYRVRARNAAGPSLWSNTLTVTTLAVPPPAPRNLVATAVTFQRIDLAWQFVPEADFYEVQQSTDGTSFTTISRPTGTQSMIFGLQPSTTYFFRVAAVNSGGRGPWSNVASATTLNVNQPAAPTDLRAVPLAAKRIRLEWRDNSVNETRFEIQRSTAGGPFAPVGTTPANTRSFIDNGLRRATTYSYRVRACNAGVCSPFSNVATATTP
jgi:hypothetical protein